MMTDSTGTPIEPIPNPYIVGNPIDDKRMFFGRRQDFGYIRTKVTGSSQGTMIVLCGTRRSGKTSILFQIQQGRLGDRFLPVLVDMQSVTTKSDVEFVGFLARQILGSVGREADEFQVEPGATDFGLVSRAFTAMLKRLTADLHGRSLVLMFDEYELFESNIDEGRLTPRVLNLLGEMMAGADGVHILFTGSTKVEERNADYWSASLGRSLHKRISFLEREDAMSLIREPVAGRVRYDDGVPELIYELSAGQPFYTQLLCQYLVDLLNEQRRNEARHVDINEVVQGVIDNPLPHMIFSWGALNDVEKVALAAIAELSRDEVQPHDADEILAFLAEEKTGISVEADKLNEALERLFQNDLLDKEQDGERFTFKMDLWRQWVVRMHSIWQVLDEILGEGRSPDEGIIRLARRRILRLLGAAALTAVAVGVYLLVMNAREPEQIIVPAEAPDSTWVSVTTGPVDANVFLGNYFVGTAPIDSAIVPAGFVEFRCQAEGFADYADSILLLPDTLHVLQAKLVERIGGIRVITEPPGATVLLGDDVQPGTTPLEIVGLPVRFLHDVTMRLDGYLPETRPNLVVPADSLLTVRHDFARRTHPLAVTVDPVGAEVEVDDVVRGPAPQALTRVPEGRHRIVCRAHGYFDEVVLVDIPAPDHAVGISMRPRPLALLVMRVQPYADIVVDGRTVKTGTGHHRIEVEGGSHRVEFVNEVLGTAVHEVTVDWGDTLTVIEDLRDGD